jgi:hypothetical protein
LIIACLGSACATVENDDDSNPPSPSAGETNQIPQQKTNPDQRGTNDTPLVVRIVEGTLGPERDQTETNEKTPHKWWGLSTDDWLAIFTGALVLVGFIQFLVFKTQAYWLRRTVQSDEESIYVTESAYIFPIINNKITTNIMTGKSSLTFAIRAVNYGRTPGFVDYICINEEPVRDIEAPILPTRRDDYPRHLFVGWTVYPTATGQEFTIDGHAFIPTFEIPLKEPMIFHGLITYTDVFGINHYTGFARRINEDGTTQSVRRADAYERHDKRRRIIDNRAYLLRRLFPFGRV